jgi:putative ABC transport system permease protein
MRGFRQDLRYGLRMLLRSRGVTAVAVLALALGIGANTAIFSLVEVVLLRPLPFRDADRLTMVWENNLQRGIQEFTISAPTFLDYRSQSGVFEGMVAFEAASFALTGRGEPERIRGLRVTTGFLPLLGVRPARGRDFLPAEMRPGGEGVIIVSHGLWVRRFGSDPNLLGQALTLDGKSFTVSGIMAPGFEFPERTVEFWMPLVFTAQDMSFRGYHHLSVIARLKADVPLEQAWAEMNGLAGRLAQQHPVTNRGWGVTLVPLRDQQVREVRLALLIMFGAVGFVLLIACASIANLLLARNAAREREIAIRAALGAGRLRLVRQLLAESVLLALLGGGAGLFLTPWLTRLLLAISPEDLVLPQQIGIHAGVLGFTLAVSLVTGLVFGVIPAVQASRTNLNESLKEGGRSATEGFRRHRIRSGLVILEVALALVLLVGAGLMTRSFLRLQAVDPGFRADHVLTVRLSLSESKYSEDRQRAAFFRDLLERVETLPGVQTVAVTNCLPLVSDFVRLFEIEGRPAPGPGEAPAASFRAVTPGYFRAMGVAVRRGRHFSEQDGAESAGVAIVNEDLTRRYWPKEDPIGKRVHLGKLDRMGWRTIVGVVSDVRHRALDTPALGELYVPYSQWPQAATTLVVRTTWEPVQMAGAIRAEVRAVDRDQPIGEIRTMERVVSESVAPRRAVVTLLGVFASLALILAAVGIYGVIAFSVVERTHEIGIRMALGAQRSDVLRMVVEQGLVLALVGVAIGAVASLVLTRVLSSLLYGVSATDPWTFLGVSLLLTVVAVLASYLPARHATKVDPLVALRTE